MRIFDASLTTVSFGSMIHSRGELPCHLSSSVLWRCWLGGRKGIRHVKTEWWGACMVICLERGATANLHMAQLMPLPLTVSCFSKIEIDFTFLVPAYLGSSRKRAIKRVCVIFIVNIILVHCCCCKLWLLLDVCALSCVLLGDWNVCCTCWDLLETIICTLAYVCRVV